VRGYGPDPEASSSIAANIAEGCGRGGKAELPRLLQVAIESASQLELHLLFARDLGFLNSKDYGQLEQDLVEVKQMLTALIHTIGKGTDREKNRANNRELGTEN
jgi:four helix bundle protein